MKTKDREAINEQLGSKLHQQLDEFTGAWDERDRIFNAMRNPNQTDEQRKELVEQYGAAAKNFDALRNKILHK